MPSDTHSRRPATTASGKPWRLNYELRRWQKIAFEKWRSGRRGVISVVTGGGKTIFAFHCIIDFLNAYPEGRIIIVVPTTSLMDQWYVGLCEDLGITEDKIACYSGQEKPEEPSIINVLVINTARELAPSLALEFTTFLIVDECHRAGSPINAKALKGDHIATLGLSATPVREYDEGFDERVAPALGDIVFEYDYVSAYNDHVITPFALENVKIPLLEDEKAQYDKLSRRIAIRIRQLRDDAQYDEQIKRLFQQRASVVSAATMRIPVAVRLLEHHRGERAIVFHERVDSAEKIYQILRARGHSATIYHSKIGPAMRRDNLRLYRRGVFDVLICCRALDEGMNVPETAVAVIASSTASIRQRIQRLGRVLRPAPGKEHALVYTLYATPQEAKRLEEEEHKLVDVATTTWSKTTISDGANSL